MSMRIALNQGAGRHLVGPLLIALLAVAGCGDVRDLIDGHGHPTPPPGTADGGSTPSNPCALTLCVAGTHCEAQTVQCVKAPCPPIAVCLKNAPTVGCGGLAGTPCPGFGRCADDPSDSCDSTAGSADCPGICQCVQNVLCVKGAKFDPSPQVCACVTPTIPPPACGPVCEISCDNGDVLDANGCPTCRCNPSPPEDPCAAVDCVIGNHCVATNVQCVKAPCPPIFTCVPDAPAVHCGGIAGIACPGSGKCVDDPTDSCDPQGGGADCGGICQCVQNAACVRGAIFDSSPKICACVSPTPPPPPICGPVCQLFCQYGNVLDASGCATCKCNPPPAANMCPVEKCTGPAPKSVNYVCPDGKTIAGPACVVTSADNCEWTVLTCPATGI